MSEVAIIAGAEEDYSQSLQWYVERSMQAAQGFEAEFERALEAIAANPHRYPRCDDRHRFFVMKRYPFSVIYRELPDGQLLIVAVAHAKRHPGFWSNR
jgi:plasmid stabilization system protein ParE